MFYASSLRMKLKGVFFFLGFLGLLIVGCVFVEGPQSESEYIPTTAMNGQLIPYVTTTPILATDLEAATRTSKPNPTHIPPPTSTPFVYEVVENDTLTGIAIRHSVALDDLITANPGIDPNFLTIGLTLTIPMDVVVSAALPTSTPVSVVLQPPVCYPLANGSLQCMSVVGNDQIYAVENVRVMISLQSPTENDPLSKAAIPPQNIVPAGQKTVVVTSFTPPLFLDHVAHASLLSAIPVSPEDQRYLQTELQIHEIEISQDGQWASITGAIELLPEQSAATTVWVSAFAYDQDNKIVGTRKWVADDVLDSGNDVNFELVVYSLGRSINYVDILTETRP